MARRYPLWLHFRRRDTTSGVVRASSATMRAKLEGRFGKQDFVYLPDEDVYRCPAVQRLKYSFIAD
jgi:hypothetical protein